MRFVSRAFVLDEGFFIKCDTVIHLLRSGNVMVAVPPPPKRSSLSPVPDDPPELNAALTESAVEMPLPSNPQTFFLGGVFALTHLQQCDLLNS
jgi:hypothetical protein